MGDWLEWEIKGGFRIHIPPNARTRLDDNGCTAVIQMGSGEAITEALISNYPLKQATQDRTELAIQLRDLADDFFVRSVTKALGHDIPFDVEVTEEEDQKLYWSQGVSAIGPGWDRVWVARFYARLGDSRFWIIHWNGPREDLETTMRIFVSFEPEVFSFR